MKKIAGILFMAAGVQLFPGHSYGQLQPINTTINTTTMLNANLLTVADYSKVPARELNTFRNFQENVDGDNKVNAYLMSYVSTFVYPERIQRLLTGEIWDDNNPGNTDNDLFESNFRKKFEPMFWDGSISTVRPVIKFKRLPDNS